MLVFGIVMIIGIAAMIQPPVKQTQPISPVSLFITIGIIAIVLVLVLASALDRRQRELLLSLR